MVYTTEEAAPVIEFIKTQLEEAKGYYHYPINEVLDKRVKFVFKTFLDTLENEMVEVRREARNTEKIRYAGKDPFQTWLTIDVSNIPNGVKLEDVMQAIESVTFKNNK